MGVGSGLHEILAMRKLSARWVPPETRGHFRTKLNAFQANSKNASFRDRRRTIAITRDISRDIGNVECTQTVSCTGEAHRIR